MIEKDCLKPHESSRIETDHSQFAKPTIGGKLITFSGS